jgi:predicted RNA-binding protein with TRAM domain
MPQYTQTTDYSSVSEKMSYGNRGSRYGGGGSYGGNRDRGYGRAPMDSGPKPVETGKEYDVEITEISRRGDGVAKIQGFIIFVKGARVGEKVKIKVESVGPRFATATSLGASAEKPAAENASSDSSVAEPVQ